MKNIKLIVSFSVFGFFISLISGFFSKGTFGRIFVHALIFAVVFALLGFAISILFEKVLDINQDSSTEAIQGEVNTRSPVSEHTVDITVQDEELPTEENASQFYVGSNHQMLNADDLTSSPAKTTQEKSNAVENKVEPVAELPKEVNATKESIINSNSEAVTASVSSGSSESNGFVPMNLAENAKTFSSIEPKTDVEIKKEESIQNVNSNNATNEDELDSLPDLENLGSFQPTSSSHSSEENVEVESDSTDDFPKKEISAEEVTAGKDAEVMAKAISTLLAKD